MKYIKLFEQFEEESWWDEESPFDNLLPRLRIGRHGTNYYLLEDVEDPKLRETYKCGVRMFDISVENGGGYPTETFTYGDQVKNDTQFRIVEVNKTSYVRYDMLPKEIKDRII
jgi:hypothetical protein